MSRTTRNTIIGWGFYLILITIVTLNAENPEIVGMHAFSIYIVQLIIFYANYLFLAPKILEQKKFWLYFLIIAAILTVFAIISFYVYLEIRTYTDTLRTDREMVSIGKWGPVFRSFVTNIISIVISNLIIKSKLLVTAKQEQLELKNKILEAETMALKAQINPHFLFNALNNIYALSQTDSSKTGDAVLQLSHLLSYITYEGNKKHVLLEMEVDYIKHFVQLQFLKDDDNSNITVQLPEEIPPLEISPLLLIPFIENAFKHSNVFDKKNGWVKINLNIDNTMVHLNVDNSIGQKEQRKDKVGGVGLENVKKRLALLYKDSHTLNIEATEHTYNASLKIDLAP